MSKSANGAYAGEADMPNGVRVSVFYLDRARLLKIFGYQPPGHPARKRIGWYWARCDMMQRVDKGPKDVYAGPFTSSRLAVQDAIKRNGADQG